MSTRYAILHPITGKPMLVFTTMTEMELVLAHMFASFKVSSTPIDYNPEDPQHYLAAAAGDSMLTLITGGPRNLADGLRG